MNVGITNGKQWRELGFRCGLEIHHQIDTERKLFCRCPAGHYKDSWHAEVIRHMRPTLSELGEYDGTALMEFKTKKEIVYRLHRETVCTYEMDDTPPFLINQDAVDIALTVAHAFRCKIVGELHIIRKQYLDGSIPTGFQRTCIVGVDGKLPLSNGKRVPIIQIGLEEDSCREISDIGHRIVFMTDRLSMPLIEVVTEKVLETPEEAAEATWRIGQLLRATGMVRRGAGAGREDVNVSIEGSTRVEIKGVPKISRIPELTAWEALRQKGLLELRDEIARRGVEPAGDALELTEWIDDQTGIRRPEVLAALRAGDRAMALRVPGAAGLLGWPLGNDRRFVDELAGRVRVIACLEAWPVLLHSEGGEASFNEAEQEALRQLLGAGEQDAVLLVWGPEQDLWTAAREILERWNEAFGGVPNETRQAMRNNSTDFERVLPGPDRMYPDTDSPPTMLTDERIERTRSAMPEPPWERQQRHEQLGVPPDIALRLAVDPRGPLLDRYAERGLSPVLAGELLVRMPVALRREGVPVGLLGDRHYEALLAALAGGRLFREGLPGLLARWSSEPECPLEDVLRELKMAPLDEPERDELAQRSVEQAIAKGPRKPEATIHLAMKEAMDVAAGSVAGREMRAAIEGVLQQQGVPA